MTTPTLSDHQINIIESFGFELLSNGTLGFSDAVIANKAHLHHTFEPVAAAGWARLAPAIAAHRLADYTFGQLVTKRPAMDCYTAECFALACGLSIKGPFANRGEQFYRFLSAILEKYDLDAFFGHYPEEGEHHYGIRPRGFDWPNRSQTLPDEMRRFRAAYRRLPVSRQMLVASIMWLYRGSHHDETWMKGLNRSWNAVYGILELKAAGMLGDWGELVARYPGW